MTEKKPPAHDVDMVFKSGAVVCVNLEHLTVKKDGFGVIAQIEWTNGNDRILHLDIDELAAVIQR